MGSPLHRRTRRGGRRPLRAHRHRVQRSLFRNLPGGGRDPHGRARPSRHRTSRRHGSRTRSAVPPEFDLDLYAGVRPIRRYAAAPGPLATRDPFSFTNIRENTEGLYASRGGGAAVGDKVCTDAPIIIVAGSDRIIRFAFDYALANAPLSGPPTVTCVDKANVLRSYAFFRSRFDALAKVYSGRVATNRVYADAFCGRW